MSLSFGFQPELLSASLPQQRNGEGSLLAVMNRREIFSGASLATGAAVFGLVAPATASPSSSLGSTTLFDDTSLGVKFLRPSGWVPTVQALPDRRRLTMFISGDNKDNNMFVNATPVRDDYTSLSSLGSVENVGMGTILPKGELQGR